MTRRVLALTLVLLALTIATPAAVVMIPPPPTPAPNQLASTVADIASPNQAGTVKCSTTWTPLLTASGVVYGCYGYVLYNGAITIPDPGHLIGIWGNVEVDSSGNTINMAIGAEGKHVNDAGTINLGIGVLGVLTYNGGTYGQWYGMLSTITANAGTITNGFGYGISLASAGTLTNYAGYYMPDLSGSTIGTKYFLYSADATAPIYVNGAKMIGIGAGNWQLGATDAASPVAQTLQSQGARAGTDSNTPGGKFTLRPGNGTGNGAGTAFEIQRNLMAASGTGAQSHVPAITVCESKTLSNTTGVATTLATISSTALDSGSANFWVSVRCDDATDANADMVQCMTSWRNKAGAITFGSAQCLGGAAAGASNGKGTCTIAPSITSSGGNTINIVSTPVIGTIVPTTVTAMVTIINHSAGTVTCN